VTKPWEDVRESVRVKLIEHGEETYVLTRSQGRRDKEQSMRRRRFKTLIERLRELQQQNLTRDELLLKLGAAKKEAGKAYALLVIHTPTRDQPGTSETFHFALDRKKLRQARQREGGYLLRSNIKSDDPGYLWRLYLQLVEVEQAFKELKGDLSIRSLLSGPASFFAATPAEPGPAGRRFTPQAHKSRARRRAAHNPRRERRRAAG
jgi:hypothetical protein